MEHEHDFNQGGNEGKIGDDHANEDDSGSEEDAGAYFEARFEQPSLGIVLSSTEDGSTRPLDVLRTVEGGAGEARRIGDARLNQLQRAHESKARFGLR